MSNSRNAEMLRCCVLYYQEQITISEIAARLDISRFKVSRHLKCAQQREIVKIQFHDPNIEFEHLALKVEKTLGLEKVIVVPTPYGGTNEAIRLAVGRAGVDLFDHITPDTSISITWGRTIAHMADSLPADKLVAKRIVDLAGGFGEVSSSVSARAAAFRTAEKFNAECVQVPAPTIVGNAQVAKSLLTESTICRALDLASQSEIAVTGIGPISQDSLLFESGFLTNDDIVVLSEEMGAVGSIMGRFYDINGNEVRSELQSRTIALEIDRFLKIPQRIAFAGGETKLDSLIGAARGNLITTLVTDSQTAKALVEAFEQENTEVTNEKVLT